MYTSHQHPGKHLFQGAGYRYWVSPPGSSSNTIPILHMTAGNNSK